MRDDLFVTPREVGVGHSLFKYQLRFKTGVPMTHLVCCPVEAWVGEFLSVDTKDLVDVDV